MLTLNFKTVLIAALLIALIVLVVFLIVAMSRLNDTLKMANTLLKSGTAAVDGVKQKIDDANAKSKARKDKIKGFVNTGLGAAKGIVTKKLSK